MGVLALALFLSPIQLHTNPASIFFALENPHAHHHTHHQESDNAAPVKCLRCILYGFESPQEINALVVSLLVLGVLTFTRPQRPSIYLGRKQKARDSPL